MTARADFGDNMLPLDAATTALVRLAACVAAGTEDAVRTRLAECAASGVSDRWVEELVLQSYLFAGFPRALNAAREWRRMKGSEADAGLEPADGRRSSYSDVFEWRLRGEETCATVYGSNYAKLRRNIAALHPALDEWMIVEGYGKVLGRPGLDLARRELCIVAACAASGQTRQLHSHLLGAGNAGASRAQVGAALDALEAVIDVVLLRNARLLWERMA